MIEVLHLTKKYGEHTAVEDLSFTVADGTICGLLGPNGAGKTTTMNILTGYLSPTEGKVLINGHDPCEEPEEAKKTVGYLPETPPVYPDLTVYECLQFAAELKKVPRGERKEQISRSIEALGLQNERDRLIRNLSKGYRQRVGFAQALLGDPKTLILDEPTSGLDPRQIIEVRALIRKLGESHTVILSSHILSEVAEVCDHVLILSEGRLAAAGTPEELGRARRPQAVFFATAEGTEEQVSDALGKEAFSFRILGSGDGTVQAEITSGDGEDIRGAVSAALFAAGCPVTELRKEDRSLEDIFLELTDDTDRDLRDSEADEQEAGTEETAADGRNEA